MFTLLTTLSYMLSDINGVNGADSLERVSKAVYSAVKAAILSSPSPLAQNLLRQRLTYQFESESTKSCNALAASVILYSFRHLSTVSTSELSPESIHLSITVNLHFLRSYFVGSNLSISAYRI